MSVAEKAHAHAKNAHVHPWHAHENSMVSFRGIRFAIKNCMRMRNNRYRVQRFQISMKPSVEQNYSPSRIRECYIETV